MCNYTSQQLNDTINLGGGSMLVQSIHVPRDNFNAKWTTD